MSTTDIQERIDRVEQIIERLESEDVPLAEAKQLRNEADELLEELRSTLHVGEGSVTEIQD